MFVQDHTSIDTKIVSDYAFMKFYPIRVEVLVTLFSLD